MDKVIVVGVGVAVAIGTALYYLLTQKEEPQRSRSSNSSRSHNRSRSPLTSYSDIRPEPGGKRKSVSQSESPKSEPGPSRRGSSNASGLHNEPKENTKVLVSVASEKAENEYGSQPFQENLCSVCDKTADAVLQPCNHRTLCLEHLRHYFQMAELYDKTAKCPISSCRKEIDYFTKY